MPQLPGHGFCVRFIQHEVQEAGKVQSIDLNVQVEKSNHDLCKAFFCSFRFARDDDCAAPRRFVIIAPCVQPDFHIAEKVVTFDLQPHDLRNLLALVGAHL